MSELKKVEKIRYALSRYEWAETQFKIWRKRYIELGLLHRVPRLKIKYKIEGVINHDRVLTDRKQH